MKTYIGIDPGKTGAIAAFRDDQVVFYDAEYVNLASLAEAILATEEVFVLLEKAQVMPRTRIKKGPDGIEVEERSGQGAVGMLNYGIGYGKYLGMLESHKIKFDQVHPMTWKKEFNLLGKKKDASIAKAKELFPQAADELKRKKDHGRAEALLIAEFAKRKNM